MLKQKIVKRFIQALLISMTTTLLVKAANLYQASTSSNRFVIELMQDLSYCANGEANLFSMMGDGVADMNMPWGMKATNWYGYSYQRADPPWISYIEVEIFEGGSVALIGKKIKTLIFAFRFDNTYNIKLVADGIEICATCTLGLFEINSATEYADGADL